MSTPKTIMVTGAAGFIGSHLVDRLLALGHHVVGLDNLSYGSRENIAGALANPLFRFLEGDIMSPSEVEDSLEGVEQVYHLAAFKIPRYTDALDTLRINGFGSMNVLEACATRGIPVIAASTSDAYGMNPDVPFSEEKSASVIGSAKVKRWAYAVSKMFEEQLALAFRERYGIKVTLVRFFGGYGPRHNLTWWGGPQSGFITKALRGEPLEIHGDGLQTRSFTYISDHVDGLVAILDQEAADGEVLNLGSTEEVSILQLARLIWGLIRDDEPVIDFIPYSAFGRYEDVRRRVPDLNLVSRLLGFVPRVSLKEGLEKTIAWQRGKVMP